MGVVVEPGAGAWTGVRMEEECAAVADAVAAVDTLPLVGVAGYEVLARCHLAPRTNSLKPVKAN